VPSPIHQIQAREHQSIRDLLPAGFRFGTQPDDGDIRKVWGLGLQPDGRLGYYIGLDWIQEGVVLEVAPKIDDIDWWHRRLSRPPE